MSDNKKVSAKHEKRRGAHARKSVSALKTSLFAIAASLVLIVGSAAAFGGLAMFQFDNGTTVLKDAFIDDGNRPAASDGENILLMGSDTRGSMGKNPTAKGYRSDTMMILHITKDRKKIQIVSIPRDTWVPIKDNGKGKINWALSFGGVPLAAHTVEQFMGVRIDHVALIDFQGVIKLTEVLGGVPINNPRAFKTDPVAYPTVFSFAAGPIVLKGPAALAFIRERHAFKEGDIARVANQQLFIKAVMDKILSMDVLTNPAKVLELSNAIGKLLIVDAGLNSQWVLGKAVEMASFDTANVSNFTVPELKSGYEQYGGVKQYVLYANTTEVAKMAQMMNDDTLDTYVAPVQAETKN